jgi:aminopeptidase N
MESFMAQPGVPVLNFADPAGGSVHVDQKRFFLDPSVKPDPSQKWTLPACFQSPDRAVSCQLLSPSDFSLKVPLSPVFYPNAGGKGYYRMQYTPAVFHVLLARAETDLTGPERLSLAGNEWAEMRADQASIGDVLDLLAAMKSDPSAALIKQAGGDLDTIILQLATTDAQRNALAAWIRTTFAPQLKKLGDPTTADPSNIRELRAALLSLVGRYGKDPEVLAKARAIAEEYLASPETVDPTLAHAALELAAANGDQALFDRLQKIYESSTNPDIRQTALRLLARFEQPTLTERALDYAVSEKVRNQDAAAQISVAMGNSVTRDLTWAYVQSHWPMVQAQFTTTSGASVVSSTSSFCSADARDEVDKFFAEHNVPNSNKSLRQAIERIDDCIKLRKRQEPNLERWLAAQG